MEKLRLSYAVGATDHRDLLSSGVVTMELCCKRYLA